MAPVVAHTELASSYQMISNYCSNNESAMFIAKNGVQDLAVMSVATYQKLISRLELYSLLKTGLDDVNNDKLLPLNEALSNIRRKRNDRV